MPVASPLRIPSAPQPPRRTLGFVRPRLRADLEAISDGRERVIFVGEQRKFFVQGPLAAPLVRLLDGSRDVRALCAELQALASPPQVLRELVRLEHLGALAEGPAGEDRARAAFADAAGRTAEAAPAVLIGAAADLLAQPLAGTGLVDVEQVERVADLPPAGMVVAAVADYLDPVLAEINEWAVAQERPWLLTRPAGVEPWIGPLLVPGVTACWSCMAYRLGINRQLDGYLRMTQRRSTPTGIPVAATPGSLAAVAGMVAGALCRAEATPAASPLAGTMVALDVLGTGTERHQVIRRPQCPDCGDPVTYAVPRPLKAVSRPKLVGTHRVRAVADTLDALDSQISPHTGAVTSVVPVDTGTTLFSAAAAGHPFAISRTRFDVLTRLLRGSLSGGKGRRPEQARVSAVCEAVERGSALWRGDEVELRAPYLQVAAEAVSPEVLFQFSPDQYAHADERNAASESRYEYIPSRLDPATEIGWTRAWDPVGERSILVPSAYTWFGHPDMYRHWFYLCDSNGMASGSCIEEAITYGFYELAERDSVALWWYNRIPRPAVDLDSVGDPYLDDVREYYTAAGRELWVLDLTNDTEIPAFAAVSRRVDHPVEDLLVGFGCHLDPRAALGGAIDELNQFLPMVAGRNRDGSAQYWGMELEAKRWCQRASLAGEPYFAPDPAQAPRRLGDLTDRSSDDVGADVAVCAQRMAAVGLDLWAVNVSRPEVDLAVAKVIVPGLRHFWRRLGEGRLYDAPVALGWLDHPTAEADLNPETVFF